MYTSEEIEALKAREQELVYQITVLKEELRKIRKPLYTRRSYEKNYGVVREKKSPMSKEELREYNRIKKREWRAKHKKEEAK